MGRFNALTAVTFGCAVIGFGWIGVRDNAGIIVWSVFYGFVSGAVQALFSPCVSHLAPTPALIGTWNGEYHLVGTGLRILNLMYRPLHNSRRICRSRLRSHCWKTPREHRGAKLYANARIYGRNVIGCEYSIRCHSSSHLSEDARLTMGVDSDLVLRWARFGNVNIQDLCIWTAR